MPSEGGSEDGGRFGVIRASKTKFLPGEPVMLIRGTDPIAGRAALHYARLVSGAGAAKEVVEEAFDHAMRIAEWQRDNPEKVTAVPE